MYASFLRVFLSIGLLPVGLLAAANYLVDPYQVFRTGFFPEVGVTQERYLKIELLKRDQRFDTFLLGGSRMGTTNPADVEKVVPGSRVYNLFVSSGNQTDNLLHGQWLLRTQPQLKALYVQVDWPESIGAFQGNYQYLSHPEVNGKNSAGFLAQYLFLFSYHAFDFKLENNTSRRGEYKLPLRTGQFYYPEHDKIIARDCTAHIRRTPSLLARVAEEVASDEQKKLIDRSLDALGQLVTEAHKKGVKIQLYVTPYNRHFLDKINVQQYAYFLTKLANIAPYWNFGFYSVITRDDCNYYESSHYIGGVAPRLYAVMSAGGPSPDGHYVTAERVPDEVAFIEENFRQNRMAAKH